MCKKIKTLFIIFLTLMITTSCSGSMNFGTDDMNIYKKIHKKYVNMHAYSAEAVMTVYSNKTENKYNVIQYFKEPDIYKTEFLEDDGLVGLSIIEKDGKVTMSFPKGSFADINAGEVPDCTFINNFFKLYYTSQDTAINTVGAKDSKDVFLETNIFPVSKNAKKAVMKVSPDSEVEYIEIYDMGGRLFMKIEFTKINYNEDLSDEIFTIRK